MTADPATATLTLSATHQAAIFEHAEKAFPDECCGALFGHSHDTHRAVVELRVMENTWDAEERRRRFLITPAEYMRVEREADELGLTLIGFYHSHPNAAARPSEFDREHAWPWFAYPIVEVRAGKAVGMRVWQLQADRNGYDELGIDLADG